MQRKENLALDVRRGNPIISFQNRHSLGVNVLQVFRTTEQINSTPGEFTAGTLDHIHQSRHTVFQFPITVIYSSEKRHFRKTLRLVMRQW